ncbi:hypothetical protein ATE92_1831 [Ulvibacter sp. MAR_2010_11]|uniref:Ig-like domain-containing protein n=1 Tax=Ulvibacter sp. MAR_2010_11 TaxID=1250229 RepID=UPI000CC0B334|nr:Ig-like domain-containing protein [Ulvibacter sp. MAR_2010_11]PKA83666.1 hypothetical protein ATE92_1831 [Ulvibacter sp. MAR_2010_11]
MKNTVPALQCKTSFLKFSIFIFSIFIQMSFAQTQKPSVQTGVTFQWSDIQPNPNLPATINSITIDGIVYQAFAAPTTYAMTRVGPNGHNANRIIRNGTIVNNSSNNANWNNDAITAFRAKNLNHYFLSDSNGRNICGNFGAIATTDAQVQSLYYSPGIPSNAGGLIAITERNANNCYYISVYGRPVGGGPEQFLGDTFVRPNTTQWGPLFNAPPAGVDYWNSGRVLENNGTIGIAIFKLDDLAPTGSIITRFELVASTADHGDGKAFIIQKYATPILEKACLDTEFQGTLVTNNIPAGSTFSLVSGPTPAGQSFTFNANGSYSYTPELGFLGDVVFEYQVCLPFPNTTTCDTSTATISYIPWSDEYCSCSSGNADGPLLQN